MHFFCIRWELLTTVDRKLNELNELNELDMLLIFFSLSVGCAGYQTLE